MSFLIIKTLFLYYIIFKNITGSPLNNEVFFVNIKGEPVNILYNHKKQLKIQRIIVKIVKHLSVI